MKTVLSREDLGTRISDYSENVPKPVIPIGGKLSSVKNALRTIILKLFGFEGLMLARGLRFFGLSTKCPVCGASVRRLLDQGYKFPVLGRYQVIGGLPRTRDQCPVCQSNSRTRLVYFYVFLKNDLALKSERILHIAPERSIAMKIAKLRHAGYFCGDLVPTNYILPVPVAKMDVTKLPFDSGYFNLIICNHVLEHVDQDLIAMSEIRRVLHRDGTAILQTPLSLNLRSTCEGLQARSEEERIRLYGQGDHVRIYALFDYLDRLRSCGFRVTLYRAFEDDPELAMRWDLDPLEPLVVCHPG